MNYMKQYLVVFFVSVAVFGAASCSSGPTVNRVGSDTTVDLSGRWNDSDVRQVCDSLLQQALSSQRVDEYVQNFVAAHGGDNPTVIVGTFKNTSSEHIDTSIISSIMRSSIINSGKLDFVEGGAAREELRAERDDQVGNASESSAASLSNETGANLMLQGTVKSIVEKQGNQTLRSYFVTASITNLETNRILWEGNNNEVKKLYTQAKAKL